MMYSITAKIVTSVLLFPANASGLILEHNGMIFHVADAATGIIHHGRERLDSLQGTGQVTLDETKITGDVEINGSLFAKSAHMGSATINGQASLYDTTVEGRCFIGGHLTAENCTFRSQIDAKAQKITFSDCNINSINMRKALTPYNIQVVELSNCNLRGDVTFSSGNGLVILDNKSQIQGAVIGGNIQQG